MFTVCSVVTDIRPVLSQLHVNSYRIIINLILVGVVIYNFVGLVYGLTCYDEEQKNYANVDIFFFQQLAARLFLMLRKMRVTQMKALIQILTSLKFSI